MGLDVYVVGDVYISVARSILQVVKTFLELGSIVCMLLQIILLL